MVLNNSDFNPGGRAEVGAEGSPAVFSVFGRIVLIAVVFNFCSEPHM